MIKNVHRVDPGNPGDYYSAPSAYLSLPSPTTRHDIDDIGELAQTSASIPMHAIVGGGGLLFPRFAADLARVVAAVRQNPGGRLIAWGVGQQVYLDGRRHRSITDLATAAQRFDYDRYLGNFDLVGVRDYGTKYPWVPCASCLHPAFDKPRTVLHDVVVYSHRRFRVAIDGVPARDNDGASLETVLDFLGSGETIVTSSYHGAYWGALLGRRVVAVPFSSKFLTLREPPALHAARVWNKVPTPFWRRGERCLVADIEGWRDTARSALQPPEGLLAEHRARNLWFRDQVVDLVQRASSESRSQTPRA